MSCLPKAEKSRGERGGAGWRGGEGGGGRPTVSTAPGKPSQALT